MAEWGIDVYSEQISGSADSTQSDICMHVCVEVHLHTKIKEKNSSQNSSMLKLKTDTVTHTFRFSDLKKDFVDSNNLSFFFFLVVERQCI